MRGDTCDVLCVVYLVHPIGSPLAAEIRRLVTIFVSVNPPYILPKHTVICIESEMCCIRRRVASVAKVRQRYRLHSLELSTTDQNALKQSIIPSLVDMAQVHHALLLTDIIFSVHTHLAIRGPYIDDHCPLTTSCEM